MRPRGWRFRVGHIVEAIEKIAEYTRGMSFDEFSRDNLTADAVARNLEIVGEAARNVPQAFKDDHPEVPWREMNAIRNVVAHQYFHIDLGIIWDTVQNNLPPIASALRNIVESSENAE